MILLSSDIGGNEVSCRYRFGNAAVVSCTTRLSSGSVKHPYPPPGGI